MAKSETPDRLNILALPSQTTILFTLIFLVIGLPVLLSAVGRSVPSGPFVIVCVIMFTVWDFLSAPDRQIRKLRLTNAAPSFPALNEHFCELATSTVGLPHPPRLLISSEEYNGIYGFGTFTRRYVALSRLLAQELEATLKSPDSARCARAEAVLLHELAHFRNGDVWKALLSRSLLKVAAVFFSVSLFNTLLIPFLYHYGARFYLSNFLLSPEMVRSFDPEAATILETLPQVGPQAMMRYELYVLNAHWPLIVGSLLLLFLFWRRLLRLRELYADARVIVWQKSAEPLLSAIPWIATVTALQPTAPPRRRLVPRVAFGSTSSTGWLRRLFSVQPGFVMRRCCLEEPHRIYGGTLNFAAVAGITVVLLNLTLSSLFTSRFIRGPNATLPLVVGFTVLAVSYIPLILRWSSDWSKMLRPLGLTVAGFTLIRIAPQVLVGALIAVGIVLYPEAIDQGAYALLLIGGEDLPSLGVSPSFVMDVFVIRPLLFSALVIPLLLFLLLVLDTYLKREILTWYGARLVRKHPAAILWSISGILAAIVALGILPIANALIFPTAHSLLAPTTLIGFTLLVPLLIGAPLILWLGHRRYARRCPTCEAKIPGYYSLGCRCDQCKGCLHPRLTQSLTASP